jgi:hypothetical protein
LLQRQRKRQENFLGKKTRSRDISERSISKRSNQRVKNSEEDLKERYLDEIDPRKSFREY